MSQSAESARRSGDTAPSERLGIAGSGTIACGLAACAASSGLAVRLWARSEQSLVRARDRIERERDGNGNIGEVALTRDLDSLTTATLLVEAVAEDQGIKER